MKLTVRLNGTKTNPYHALGLERNPFPQLADARYDVFEKRLAQLAAEPIPDKSHIRNILDGWSPEFVKLCCDKFIAGKMVVFDVDFPE